MRTEDHVDRMLDAALEMTFPASDPIAVYLPPAVGEAQAIVTVSEAQATATKELPLRRRRLTREPWSMPLVLIA